MGIVTPFRRRTYPRASAPVQRLRMNALVLLLITAVISIAGYLAFSGKTRSITMSALTGERFAACSYLARHDCVIDGDTFYYRGEKIRIADIDAPETSGAQCDFEAELGERATLRLRELLNDGPFELQSFQSRDTDRYGRKLRVVIRDGVSIGERLVAEGLARRWTGRRMPWCT